MKKDTYLLKGKSFGLRELRTEDVDGNYRNWLNDREVVQFNSHGRFPVTKNDLIEFVQGAGGSTSKVVLAIVDLKNDSHIGNISLQSINWIDRNAEIAFLLGEKEYWGKGVMYEAGKLLIDHGFNTLNLHRIYCGTSSENIAMQKLAKKLGMKKEGVRSEAIFKHGKYFDVVEYGILNATR